MPVKLRLRRLGRKGRPYYHIVAADSRAPRDGKYLEKVGSYDPTRDPAHIEVDHDSALKWLHNGAQPTDTVRAIFRYTGVNLKFALRKQGKDEDAVNAIFSKWSEEKTSKIENKIEQTAAEKQKKADIQLKAEKEKRAATEARIAARNAPPVEETETPEGEATEAATEEGPKGAAEIAESMDGTAPAVEAPKEEPKEETPAADAPKEEPKAETPAEKPAKEEAPVEAAAEETPAEAPAKDEAPAEEKKSEE